MEVNKMAGFAVTITEASKEFTARERIMVKDTTNAIKFDEVVTTDSSFVLTPVAYAVLSVHNEKSKDNKDYKQYIVIADDGNKYITGSSSFWNSFISIWEEMGDEEKFSIEVYKKDSKNYKGKQFLTCSIV
jgi:hypothetical protein